MSTFSHWRAWLVAAMIFVFGVAVGGTGAVVIGLRQFRQFMQNPAEARGPADRAAERIGADLTKTLQLTPEQSARTQAILNDTAGNLKTIRVRAGLRAAVELRASIERLSAEMPPEKRAEFRQLIKRRFERLGLQPSETPATPP